MSQVARVTSIDALRDFRNALCRFKEKAEEALTATAMEVQRATDYLLKDQLKHWQAVHRKSEDAVTQAKLDLNRRKIARIFGHQPDTTVFEVNLRKAKAKQEQVEQKIAAIRRWQAPLDRAIQDYEGPAGQLLSMLTVDVENALAQLAGKVEALEAYRKLAAPRVADPAPSSAAPPAQALGGPGA